jgi:hypothetical protein
MVSSGRSIRGRVGLERSGSAGKLLATIQLSTKIARLTDGVAIDVEMLRAPERRDSCLFEQLGVCGLNNRVSKALRSDAF